MDAGAAAGSGISVAGTAVLGEVGAPWFVLVLPVSAWATIYICRLLVVYRLSAKVLDRIGPLEGRYVAPVLAVLGRQTPTPGPPDLVDDRRAGVEGAGAGALDDMAGAVTGGGADRPSP